MKKNQIKKILLAVAMVVVVAAGLLVYSSGKTTSMGTAKGFGGDVTVTLTLADGKIIGCTAEGKDETEGVGSTAIDQLPGAIAESGSIAVDGKPVSIRNPAQAQPSPPTPSRRLPLPP